MDLLSYRGMPMRVIQSLPHVRTVELDESRTTYKWTRWDLSFIVTLEPAAFSAVTNNPPGTGKSPPTTTNAADVQAGDTNRTMPALTDAAIRRFLEYPRGTLIVRSVGINNDAASSIITLQSPATGEPCDANNGPFCKVNSIQEVAGERLWQLHLSFTTFIYEDSLGIGGTPPILISNRWSTTTDTNELHLTDRIIDGVVHFRADRLRNPDVALMQNGIVVNAIADFFRDVFASFFVPPGFQRKHVHCVTLPQGNMIRYRIVDREQPYQQGTGPQVRMEYIERSWMWRGSVGRAAAANANATPSAGEALGWLLQLGGPIVQGGRRGVKNVSGAITQQLPKRYKTVIARAWGNRLATRQVIVQRAMQLARSRMRIPTLFLPFTAETIISYHSAQMMAQVEDTISWSFNDANGITPQGALAVANLLFRTADGLGDATFATFVGMSGDAIDDIGQDTGDRMLIQGTNNPQPVFPSQSGTHGTWPTMDNNYLAVLATQTLELIGQQPAPPP